MQLIVDSGSTKTAWCLTGGSRDDYYTTDGINPVRDDRDVIWRVLTQQLLPQLAVAAEEVSEVWFYGAGCIAPFKQSVEEVLANTFPEARVVVESDLLGAARALCGRQEGIACILGTGSNSCLYNGLEIASNVSPLGYILGDEGSGAVLGKLLVGNLLKLQMGEELRDAFLREMNLTPALVIQQVYREAQPNRFLASLVPFIVRHEQHPAIQEMLVEAFRSFFVRNIRQYSRPELPVHFVGGIACQFEPHLRRAAALEGFTVGRIDKAPIGAMADYHRVAE